MMNVRREDLPKLHDPVAVQAELERRRADGDLRENMLAAARNASPDASWFALAVANRCERTIAEAMEAEKICVWMPERTKLVSRFKKRKPVKQSVPIFDGYLFVSVVPSASAFGALGLFDGVKCIVGFGEQPTPIRTEYVNGLRKLVECGAFDDGPRPRFKPGDIVEVKSGTFQFMSAVVAGYRGTMHVRCLVQIFGRDTPATIPIANLIKIG